MYIVIIIQHNDQCQILSPHIQFFIHRIHCNITYLVVLALAQTTEPVYS